MAYITTAQLSARLGATFYARLTDRFAGVTASETVAQQIIDEAEAELDSYLAQRYRTPIDIAARPELANVLEARALDVAEYIAWKSSPFVNDPPERARRTYDATLAWLRAVARGELPLPATAPPAWRAAEDDAARVRGGAREFTARELDGL